MPVIHEDTAADHACPWNNFAPCQGPRCMAWARHGRAVDYQETDNLIETEEGLRPSGEAPESPGEGWERDGPEMSKGYHRSAKDDPPKARAQKWIKPRKRVEGHCARAGHGDCYMSY